MYDTLLKEFANELNRIKLNRNEWHEAMEIAKIKNIRVTCMLNSLVEIFYVTAKYNEMATTCKLRRYIYDVSVGLSERFQTLIKRIEKKE